MLRPPEVQSKILRRSRGTDDYAIYQAALEWGLVDPIIIDSRDDLKSEIRWHDRVEPYHHQVSNLITFCRRLPVTLLADDVGLKVTYCLDDGAVYSSTLTVSPSEGQIVSSPDMAQCATTGRRVPVDALATCDVSGARALRHLLVKSEISDRCALREHVGRCALTGKLALKSELEDSSVTAQLIGRPFLKVSAISGRKAEPEHMGRCDFTGMEALRGELAVSQVSARTYRADQSQRSAISGMVGHSSEFITCPLTTLTLLPAETEKCEITGTLVASGQLQRCAISGKRVLPPLLERSISGRSALKEHMATSSISGARMVEDEVLSASNGQCCSPSEGFICAWSGQLFHPLDVGECELTGLLIHRRHLTAEASPRLRPLAEMLDGTRRAADAVDSWPSIAELAAAATHGKCVIEGVLKSPDGRSLAVCAQVKTFLGFKVRHIGFLYFGDERSIVGRIAEGRRTNSGWEATRGK